MRFILLLIFFAATGCDSFTAINSETGFSSSNDKDYTRFVFKKNNSIYWGYDSDNVLNKVSSEALEMVDPVWSPDGSRILFAKIGNDLDESKSVANLEVVDKDGNILNDIAVLIGFVNGVFVDGLRAVEEIGWLDNNHIFALGSVNPNVVEFRLFDLSNNSESPGYLGTSFAICPKYGKIAFFDYLLNKDYFSLVISGNEILKFPKKTEDYSVMYLKWVEDCSKLALIEFAKGEYNALKVDNNGIVREKIRLPIRSISSVRFFLNNLLLVDGADSFLLDLDGFSIYPAGFLTDKIKARLEWEKALNILFSDWY